MRNIPDALRALVPHNHDVWWFYGREEEVETAYGDRGNLTVGDFSVADRRIDSAIIASLFGLFAMIPEEEFKLLVEGSQIRYATQVIDDKMRELLRLNPPKIPTLSFAIPEEDESPTLDLSRSRGEKRPAVAHIESEYLDINHLMHWPYEFSWMGQTDVCVHGFNGDQIFRDVIVTDGEKPVLGSQFIYGLDSNIFGSWDQVGVAMFGYIDRTQRKSRDN